MLRRILLLLLIYGMAAQVWAACTGSSPTWTTTIDQTSLQTCITSSVNGDTINVGAGSATYSGGISITKNIA